MSGDGKPPTVNEERWMQLCRLLTCAACFRLDWDRPMSEQHHILNGGRRIGHCVSIPLCHEHHQPPGGGGPAVICRQLKCTEFDLLNDTMGRVIGLLRSGA